MIYHRFICAVKDKDLEAFSFKVDAAGAIHSVDLDVVFVFGDVYYDIYRFIRVVAPGFAGDAAEFIIFDPDFQVVI